MKRALFALVFLLATCLLIGQQATASHQERGEFEKLLADIELAWAKMPEDRPMPFDWLLQDLVSQFINQKPSNENGTRGEFKTFAISDDSNDDATRLTAQELIIRSGFKFEYHQAVADDGYVTGLIRLVNPLVSRGDLRRPPVLLEHGGTIDTTAYLMASSIQHRPEPWPRSPSAKPFTSWNRSLAFTLANNGFDCWLAETRGSNERNLKRVQPIVQLPIERLRNSSAGESDEALEVISNGDYWSFSQDDIINYELKSHMDKVMNVTGAEKLHIMTFSLSTATSLAFFSSQPHYARLVQAFVSMSPVVTGDGLNLILKGILETVCPRIPDAVGHILFTTLFASQRVRDLLILAARNKIIRYTVLKAFITYFLGPSAKYQTHLELNVLGHMFRKLSFKEVKQMCQQISANRLQMFDYGPTINERLYNSSEAPAYDLSNLEIGDWIMVSGANDKLATLEMANNLIELVNPKPAEHIIAPGFNHLDMFAGHDNDKYINLPIVDYFTKMSLVSMGEFYSAASARTFNLSTYLPADFSLEMFQNSLKNVTDTLRKPEVLIENIQKSFNSVFEGLSKTFKFTLP